MRNESTTGEKRAEWVSTDFVDGGVGVMGQATQLWKFQAVETSKGGDGSFERLGDLKVPVLVTQGHVSC
jgi:hypothetical protein